jgi:WD40 repeat protein
MRTLTTRGFALSTCTAILLLTGCGGSPLLSESVSDSSWALPKAQTSDLLYVTSYTGTFYWVYMFSYPAGKLVGKIAKEISGLCSDNHGNVYMTQSFDSTSTIFKYAHGGRKPIATLADPYNGASACAVDPVTGDLAVANSDGGTVAVYSHAHGKPKRYYTSFAPRYVAYAPKGELFAFGGRGSLAELINSQFEHVTQTNHIDSPLGMQWDGKYLTLGDSVGEYYEGLIRR